MPTTLRVASQLAFAIALCLFPPSTHSGHSVRAQNFVPIHPPTTCPTTTNYDWIWDSFDDRVGVERAIGNPAVYHDNQLTIRRFVGNRWSYFTGYFVTDRDMAGGSSSDFLMVYQTNTNIALTWGISPTDYWQPLTASRSLVTPISMLFSTNTSQAGAGFRISRVRLCDGDYDGWVTDIEDGVRYQGVLLGTNDVVYLRMPGAQPGQRLNLALWDGFPEAPNIDLYVRCGSNPTPSIFLKRSNTADGDEFLFVTNSECPHTSTLYIGIASSNGAGAFNFLASKANPPRVIRVAYEIASPEDPLQTLHMWSMMLIASRRLYGATDGQVMVSEVHIARLPNGSLTPAIPPSPTDYTTCRNVCQAALGQPCDVCWTQEGSGGSLYASFNPPVFIAGMDVLTSGDTAAVAHEFGHTLLQVNDESNGTQVWCGHSMMARHWAAPNYCDESNHELDQEQSMNLAFDSVWEESALPLNETPGTPDWYSFSDHILGDTPVVNFY